MYFAFCHCRLLTVSHHLDLVLTAGKSTKNVNAYIIIPPPPPPLDVKRASDLLLKTRETAGIPPTNKYLFARCTANTSLSGNTDLREIVADWPNLECPERIDSRNGATGSGHFSPLIAYIWLFAIHITLAVR